MAPITIKILRHSSVVGWVEALRNPTFLILFRSSTQPTGTTGTQNLRCIASLPTIRSSISSRIGFDGNDIIYPLNLHTKRKNH
jgi:hypothetical protein